MTSLQAGPAGGRARIAPMSSVIWFFMDALCIVSAFSAAVFVLYGRVPDAHELHFASSLFVFVAYPLLFLFFLWGFEMYSVALLRPSMTLLTLLLCSVYSVLLTMLLHVICLGHLDWMRFLLTGAVMALALLAVWRVSLYHYHKNSQHRQKMLMIEIEGSDNARVRRMKYASLSRFDSWYEQVDTSDIEKVKTFIELFYPPFDVICLMESVSEEVRDLFLNEAIRQEKELYIVPIMYELNFAKVGLELFDDVMVFHLLPHRIRRSQMIVKRVLDIALSAAGLAVAAVPMLLIALLIRLMTNGPVFFRQERLTKGKRKFDIIKFRTMVEDAESKTGPMLSTKGDPRVTPIGRVLRASRMDELPQLFNIIKGDMSLVGPRPERPFFVEQYERQIENYDRRFLVRAGLTSLSHVHGRYSTDIADRTRYDMIYVQDYSLLMDFKILLQTTRTIFLKEASEGVSQGPPYNTSDRQDVSV